MRRTLLEGLLHRPLSEPPPPVDAAELEAVARAVGVAARARLGRSLSIREIDAGSCNGCELEIIALGNAFYDLERFGLRFVASPRHADVLLVTGPVTRNMRAARSSAAPSAASSGSASAGSVAGGRRPCSKVRNIRDPSPNRRS